MAKSRGRDGSITRGTLPLGTTRLMGITPLGVSFSAAPLIVSDGPSPRVRRGNPTYLDVVPVPTNRVASVAPRNDNLYRPAPIAKGVKVCADRNIRREVIFASGKGGRNGMKTARFTRNSKVKCK